MTYSTMDPYRTQYLTGIFCTHSYSVPSTQYYVARSTEYLPVYTQVQTRSIISYLSTQYVRLRRTVLSTQYSVLSTIEYEY